MKIKMREHRVVARMATQTELDAGLKIDNAALVDVEWLDACAHMNVEKLDKNNLAKLLCKTNTLGRVVAQDRKVICVATNISKVNGADIIAIPVNWIEKINIMERN